MGRIGEVVKISTEDGRIIVASDPGAGDITSNVKYSPPGEDSKPLVGDFSADMEVEQSGEMVCVGTIEEKSNSKTNPGEVRRYSRNLSGDQVAEIYLKNNGDIVVSNSNATVTVSAGGGIQIQGGVVDINGATIDADGNVSDTKGSLDQLREEFNTFVNTTYATHTHISSAPGNPSGPPIP